MLKWIIILLFILWNGIDAYLDHLNDTYNKRELPANVKDVYDEAEYRRYLAYTKENSRIDILASLVGDVLSVVFLAVNIYALLWNVLPGGEYLKNIQMVVIYTLITSLVGLPFSYHSTFVIEEKYGMNKSTKKTFFLDELKSLILGLIVSIALIEVVTLLFGKFGNLAIVLTILILIAVNLVLTLLVMPLLRIFNRFTPLEEGELRESLEALCAKYGVAVKQIYVRDASRRTTKANAFCTGLTKKKIIALDDNLVRDYTPEEITAVFAHEFGHARYHHVVKSLPLALLSMVLTIAVLGWVLNQPALFTAFGFTGINYYFAFILVSIVIWPLNKVVTWLSSTQSRRHEYEADAFAAREGYGPALISSLKRLHKEALSDINPHPLIVKLSYSHPTLSQRIAAIEKEEKSKNA